MALAAEPPAFVTVIGPLRAPAGTTATTVVADFTVKLAIVPLKLTPTVPTKWSPEIVTFLPTDPLAGENFVITGAGFGKPLSI